MSIENQDPGRYRVGSHLGSTVDALKQNPALIFLITLNIIFMLGAIWFLSSLLEGFREVNTRRDKIVETLATRECFPPPLPMPRPELPEQKQ